MESFWLAETLKYTYMLQLDTPDSIDLEKYVMNTVSVNQVLLLPMPPLISPLVLRRRLTRSRF